MALGTECRIHVSAIGDGLLNSSSQWSCRGVKARHKNQARQNRTQDNTRKPNTPTHRSILSWTELTASDESAMKLMNFMLDAEITVLYTPLSLGTRKVGFDALSVG